MLQAITMRMTTQLLFLLLALSFTHCKRSNGDPNRINGEMNVDGRTRTYFLNLPPGYWDNTDAKLSMVIVLHGLGGSASQADRDYGISAKGNSEGFIVVYPEGIQSSGPAHLRSWNTGTCCPVAETLDVNDVHYISALIDKLVAEYKVNPKKIYVAGMSNGAMMAYTLACELSYKVAAIASVSGTLMMNTACHPERVVPIVHIHSAADTKVPYNGGPGLTGIYFTPVDSTLQVWSQLDSCQAPEVSGRSNYTFKEWKGANGQPVIDLYLTQDGGHSWPGGLKPRAQADPPSTAINATDVMWNFFRQYSLP